jgi:hypothetical protein
MRADRREPCVVTRVDLSTLARDAYVYGYPMVHNVGEALQMTIHPRMALGAPVNLFAHASTLAGPSDHFVSVNNDTLYSVAQCDVTREPLLLHLPDTDGRYYVMQLVDAWTNNFAYLGRRATGTGEGSYALVGPRWTGTLPDGLTAVAAPTEAFSIVGRFAVAGAADVPAVTALQRQTWLTPLSRYPAPPVASGRRMGDWDFAPWDQRVPQELRFWERLRSWMRRFPPPAGDREFVAELEPLGLLRSDTPYVQPDAELVSTLRRGAEAGIQRVEEATRHGGEPVNGWLSAVHAFDYNLDHLELGTIDSPRWKLADRRQAYLRRAAAARAGLWGNHGYEAAYAWTYVDDHGEQLNGERAYRMRLDVMPPVDAFWSLTMYDLPNYYLVDNPIQRYSLGDRTPGLRRGGDGSLEIVIQRQPPPPAERANWLPAPTGDFRPLLRMYQPRVQILDGAYQLPPIRRVG